MYRIRTQKGITLIALIITVIILLILAGTAISISINGGNLFEKTAEAREKWNESVKTEEQEISDIASILNHMTATPDLPNGWNTETIYTSYTDGTEDTRQVPIPKGFVASEATGENTVAGGLVIYKGTTPVTDENVATAQITRDQYVWIPVQYPNSWGSYNEERDTALIGNSKAEQALTLTTDYTKMKESVAKYYGFYISRYELNADGGSKKGKIVANSSTDANIGGVSTWYGLYNLAHQDIMFGSTIVLKGHMMFNGEFSKMESFINQNNSRYSTTAHPEKQQTGIHLSGIVADNQDGKVEDVIKNIYDLENNCREWTACLNTYMYNQRFTHGNGTVYAESACPVTATYNYMGTRIALYVP